MDIIDGQINIGLDWDSDIESQTETDAHYPLRVNKQRVAKRFEYIIFGQYILQYFNFLLLWLFPLIYGVAILVSISYK